MKNEKDLNQANNADVDSDDMCDIYVSKVCDSCGDCLGLNGSDYRVVQIDGILKDGINDEIDIDEYMLDDTTLNIDSDFEQGQDNDNIVDVKYEYIEDIPEVKEEYDKKIDTLLGRE
jgi:Fe-S-cluster containining protein